MAPPLEARVPRAPAGNFSRKQRELRIKRGLLLPPAWRVPTERSLHFFLKGVLCCAELLDAIQTWRTGKENTLRRIAEVITRQLISNTPSSRHALIKRLVRDALLSDSEGNYYSIAATEKRLRHLDYEDCCARDHYTSRSYGKRFHPYVIYRFILFLQTHSELLRSKIDQTASCAVCKERAARRAEEGGVPVIWRQAEPCRHWTCDTCTRELAARGMADHCGLCRARVISYPLGVAPGANQS